MKKLKGKSINSNYRLSNEIEKSINVILDKKLKKTKLDLKSLMLSASKSGHSRAVSQAGKGLFNSDNDFGSSLSQTFSSLANALQRNLYRNL
jgi:hypothetical protein